MPASSSRALTRSEADLLIAQMQEQLRLMQAARPATPAPETQPDPREESGSESESSESKTFREMFFRKMHSRYSVSKLQ